MLKRSRLWVLSLVLAATAGFSAASAAGPAIVRPDPVSSQVQVGQIFVVTVYLQDIVDVYGADVRMCFDPTLLQVQDSDAAAPGVQIQPLSSFMQPGFIIKREAQNDADAARENCPTGGLAWYAFTQLNPAEPKSGSGAIAAVTFRGLKAGTSPLTIEYRKVANRDGVEIPTARQDGSVIIAGPAAMPRLLMPLVRR